MVSEENKMWFPEKICGGTFPQDAFFGEILEEAVPIARNCMRKVRKFLCIGPDYNCGEFRQSIDDVNVFRGKLTALFFAAFEVAMLVWSMTSGNPGAQNGTGACYRGMYLAMVLAMLVFFLVFHRYGKDTAAHAKAIGSWGMIFAVFILCWCAGVSLLDYASSRQIMVYTFALLAIAVTPYIMPLNFLAVLLPVHAVFLYFLINVVSPESFPTGAVINSTAFVLMAWLISAMRFQKQIAEMQDGRLIERKNEELLRVNRELEEANEKLRILSCIDGMTGIANRSMFDVSLAAGWSVCGRQSSPLTLFMIDLDFFKGYNDYYGHQAGDECLRRVAGTLSSFARRPSDTAARYGGEEFALILPFMGRSEAETYSAKLVEQIRALEIPYESSKVSRYVTISLGASTVVPDGSSPDCLVAAADRALYLAKKQRDKAVLLLPGEGEDFPKA